jgi:hypothetical protein
MGPGKLHANLVWLFGLGAILLALGGGYATANMGVKVSSAVFLGVFAVAGFLAAYLTAAGTGRTILAFLTASILTGGLYYVVISRAIAAAAGDSTSGASAGSAFGAFFAAVVFLETVAAGIAGILVASKAKAAQLQAVR